MPDSTPASVTLGSHRGDQALHPTVPTDEFLVVGLIGGDAAALRKLMDRYDRLVRFTIYRSSRQRCRRDPHWLESIASATWEGFVRSVHRNPHDRPVSCPAYLCRIARNRVISELRRATAVPEPVSLDSAASEQSAASQQDDPAILLSRLEDLDALRHCLSGLAPDDRTIVSQLAAITDRQWRQAADALDMKESTLRSRWKRILDRLRSCLQEKTGRPFAP